MKKEKLLTISNFSFTFCEGRHADERREWQGAKGADGKFSCTGEVGARQDEVRVVISGKGHQAEKRQAPITSSTVRGRGGHELVRPKD